MPSEVAETTSDLPTAAGNVTMTTFIAILPTSNYAVTVVDLTDATVKKGADALFAEYKTNLGPGVKITSEKKFTTGAYAGREYLLDIPLVGKRKMRLYLIGK